MTKPRTQWNGPKFEVDIALIERLQTDVGLSHKTIHELLRKGWRYQSDRGVWTAPVEIIDPLSVKLVDKAACENCGHVIATHGNAIEMGRCYAHGCRCREFLFSGWVDPSFTGDDD